MYFGMATVLKQKYSKIQRISCRRYYYYYYFIRRGLKNNHCERREMRHHCCSKGLCQCHGYAWSRAMPNKVEVPGIHTDPFLQH